MTKLSLIISLNMKYKNQDKNMMCARCKFKIKIIIKNENNKMSLWCKIVFKIGVEHSKDNMRRIAYICTMLRV
jgi:hypothetical protein